MANGELSLQFRDRVGGFNSEDLCLRKRDYWSRRNRIIMPSLRFRFIGNACDAD